MTPRMTEASAGRTPSSSSKISTEAANRFQRLHQDATQRQNRLDQLRKQSELEGQKNGPSAKLASVRMWSNGGHDRLYQDAVERQEKIRKLQQRAEEERRQEESREATFTPMIRAS